MSGVREIKPAKWIAGKLMSFFLKSSEFVPIAETTG